MITTLRIKNFKSHKDTDLVLGNLTLLCGLNGVGKSSIFQSLLLLRQTYQKNRLDAGLDLNKPLCDIGSAKDALYQYAEEDEISFAITTPKDNYSWYFHAQIYHSTFLDRLNEVQESLLFFTYLSICLNILSSWLE